MVPVSRYVGIRYTAPGSNDEPDIHTPNSLKMVLFIHQCNYIRSYISGWLYSDTSIRTTYSTKIATWIESYPNLKAFHAFIFLTNHCTCAFKKQNIKTKIQNCEKKKILIV